MTLAYASTRFLAPRGSYDFSAQVWLAEDGGGSFTFSLAIDGVTIYTGTRSTLSSANYAAVNVPGIALGRGPHILTAHWYNNGATVSLFLDELTLTVKQTSHI